MTGTFRIGGLTISADHAVDLAGPYLTRQGWSYPAYDSYPGNGDRLSVGPQDTLAAGLLNAGQNALTAQYTFLDIMDDLNKLLPAPDLNGSLDEAGPHTLEVIALLFGVLDKRHTPQLKRIKLSKILHLKRPSLLPLYDDNIWRCYGKLGNPRMQNVPGRSNYQFMVDWLPEIQSDLRDGMALWRKVAALAPAGGPVVTPLRALDIVAWLRVEELEPRKRKRVRRLVA
jgi:hypothetical protein